MKNNIYKDLWFPLDLLACKNLRVTLTFPLSLYIKNMRSSPIERNRTVRLFKELSKIALLIIKKKKERLFYIFIVYLFNTFLTCMYNFLTKQHTLHFKFLKNSSNDRDYNMLSMRARACGYLRIIISYTTKIYYIFIV